MFKLTTVGFVFLLISGGSQPAHAQTGSAMVDVESTARRLRIAPSEALGRAKTYKFAASIRKQFKRDVNFGGIYITESQSGTTINLNYRGKDAVSLSKRLGKPTGELTVHQVAFSLADLHYAKKTILQVFKSRHIAGAAYIDLRQNLVVAQTRNVAPIQQLVDSGGMSKLVKLEGVASFPRPVIELHGGGAWSSSLGSCTTAFGVQGQGTTGISSAGHCAADYGVTVQVDGSDQYVQTRAFEAEFDASWASGPSTTATNQFLYNGSNLRTVTSVASSEDQVVGSPVCKFGRATGYFCSTISSNDYEAVDAAGNQVGPLVKVEEANVKLAQCGDSGGPVFYSNKAFGIISRGDSDGVACGGGSIMLYMPIDKIGIIGVSVLTE
ncbi:S1 family peptidase [Sphingomonas sp. EC-HK361]|uniref:S1 family peptidase n=1 Tax=Sphingomonas sp. EC-HK361 TaxID=2038397 RepID=UPI00125FABC8|nr:S1 family peptidase [Sphingomonas sp. EC-HK361]